MTDQNELDLDVNAEASLKPKLGNVYVLAASAVIVFIAIGVAVAMYFMADTAKQDIKKAQSAAESVQAAIKKELASRLPDHIEKINVPLDKIAKALSGLEGKRYSLIRGQYIDGVIHVMLRVDNENEASNIKSSFHEAVIGRRGDSIEIELKRKL